MIRSNIPPGPISIVVFRTSEPRVGKIRIILVEGGILGISGEDRVREENAVETAVVSAVSGEAPLPVQRGSGGFGKESYEENTAMKLQQLSS